MKNVEKIFFPLIVLAAIASVYLALKGRGFAGPAFANFPTPASSPFPIQPGLPPFALANSAVWDPNAGYGTATIQPTQTPPWYLAYNVSALPAPMPINAIGANISGCGSCNQGWV